MLRRVFDRGKFWTQFSSNHPMLRAWTPGANNGGKSDLFVMEGKFYHQPLQV
jgi:hypothetical protein